MGKTYDILDDGQKEWIGAQRMFFVATAPLSSDGRINCSPKGLDSFRILGDRQIGYVDLTGSGVETIAHLRENGRIVIMFCAFEGPPKIVRLHGRGRWVSIDSEEFPTLADAFPQLPGIRGLIIVDIERISDSCGWGVPQFEYTGQRETLTKWALQKGETGLADYKSEANATSIDGLPGLD